MLQALAKLPFNQRSALVMRELEGRSYSEIAETLEVTVSAVETLIFRARRSLRLNRDKLRALGAIQLPPSLATFFESGGGAVVGGGAIVGSGLLAKAAVVIAAGIAAGGVGYSAVHAAGRVGSTPAIATGSARQGPLPAKTFSPVTRLVSRAAARQTSAPVGHVAFLASRRHVHAVGAANGAAPAAPVDRAGNQTPAAAPSESAPTSSVATSTVATTTSIVTAVVAKAPPIPAVSSPIQVPPVPAVPLVPPLPQGDLPHPPKLP